MVIRQLWFDGCLLSSNVIEIINLINDVSVDGMRVFPFSETICCEAVAVRKDPEGYSCYVFRDLNDGSYRMVTRLPNWESPFIGIGDKGYLKYTEVLAGRDTWYDRSTGIYVPYKYDGQYLIDWVPSNVK